MVHNGIHNSGHVSQCPRTPNHDKLNPTQSTTQAWRKLGPVTWLPTSSSHNSSIFPLELRTTQNQLICFEGRALHLLVGQSLIMKCWTHGVLWSGQTAIHLFGPPLCTKIQWVWREAPTKGLITRVQHRTTSNSTGKTTVFSCPLLWQSGVSASPSKRKCLADAGWAGLFISTYA